MQEAQVFSPSKRLAGIILAAALIVGMEYIRIFLVHNPECFIGINTYLCAGLPWISLGIAASAVCGLGYTLLKLGHFAIRQGRINQPALHAAAILAMFVSATVMTMLHALGDYAIGSYGSYLFFASVVWTASSITAEYFARRWCVKTRIDYGLLDRLRPKLLSVIRIDAATGIEETVLLESLQIGDRVRIRMNDVIPADGWVLEGIGTVDESALGLGSIPVIKSPGSYVHAGSINQIGSFLMEVRLTGYDTLPGVMLRFVDAARRNGATVLRRSEKIATGSVALFCGLGIGMAMASLLRGGSQAWPHAVLVCVAAILITRPGLFMEWSGGLLLAGLAKGARKGVLVREPGILERMSQVKTIMADKTGVITSGQPQVSVMYNLAEVSQIDLLRMAASAEGSCPHPIARAIVECARKRGLELSESNNREYVRGKGVTAIVENHRVVLGSRVFLTEQGVPVSDVEEHAPRLCKNRHTVLYLAINNKCLALMGIEDPLRSDTYPALEKLNAAGVRFILATGDAAATADSFGRMLGIRDVRPALSPAVKADTVRNLAVEGALVAAVGDGVADAHILSQAYVGIALFNGWRPSGDMSCIHLVRPGLEGIAWAYRFSVALMKVLRRANLLAIGYHACAACALLAVFHPSAGLFTGSLVAAVLASVPVLPGFFLIRRVEPGIDPAAKEPSNSSGKTRHPRTHHYGGTRVRIKPLPGTVSPFENKKTEPEIES